MPRKAPAPPNLFACDSHIIHEEAGTGPKMARFMWYYEDAILHVFCDFCNSAFVDNVCDTIGIDRGITNLAYETGWRCSLLA